MKKWLRKRQEKKARVSHRRAKRRKRQGRVRMTADDLGLGGMCLDSKLYREPVAEIEDEAYDRLKRLARSTSAAKLPPLGFTFVNTGEYSQGQLEKMYNKQEGLE